MSVSLSICTFNTEPGAWHRVNLLGMSVACMSEYCQLCWERGAWSTKDFLKVNLISFLKNPELDMTYRNVSQHR